MSDANLTQPLSDHDTNDADDPSAKILAVNDPSAEILAVNDPSPTRIDTNALNGLRGFAALHIMIFHSLYYSKLQWNILGSVQMPLFFLISGFIFGLSEGKRLYLPTKCCTELKSFPDDQTGSNEQHFDGKNYYQRRIARIIPLYYLTNLLCIPLVFSGHGWLAFDYTFIVGCVLTLFVATTWFGKVLVLNGPSWFCSTIFFFYWCFPSLLPKLQRMDNVSKQKWTFYYFWIQFLVGIILFFGLFFNPYTVGDAFTVATFWPPSRLPVFIMGILAGLLRSDGLPPRKGYEALTPEKWTKFNNINGICMILAFILLSGVETVFKVGLALWMQLGMAWWQILFVVGLTFDNGTSVTYKILSSTVAVGIGRISYALYLVHEPLIQYICWVVYGPITRPSCSYEECKDEWDEYNDKRLMPLWCIPILWAVSTVIAVILNRLFEEPMRKCLRPAKK